MASGRSTPTLEDVARLAGVSTATVSRCLNDPGRVIEATRRRVMEAVAQLGYSPNFGARAMAARRTNTIGAIIPTMENAIFARGVQAFQEELHDLGFTLLVASSSYRADLEEEQIRSLVARGADGLMLIGYDRDPAIYRFLDAQGVPSLVTWSFDVSSDRPAVGFDNRAAMHGLTRKVLAMGHRRLAAISADTASNDRARFRIQGIRDAMRECGLDPGGLPIVETTYSIDSGAGAFEQLMGLQDRPTAVLCGNDVLAIGALRRAQQMGVRVPHDVSITGFDDIEIAQIAVPALTTVHVPHREMGRTSACELVRMVRGETTSVRVELRTEVRLRESLGPLP